MDKIDRVMEITDRYLERFGRALIGIYYLPPLAENWKFTVFINSLLVTLRRMDLMPCYTWNMDASGGHYLILWLNGYFRNDLSDVTPVIFRWWQLQNTLPLTVIDSILLSTDNQEYGKSRLRQFLYSPGLNQTVTANILKKQRIPSEMRFLFKLGWRSRREPWTAFMPWSRNIWFDSTKRCA